MYEKAAIAAPDPHKHVEEWPLLTLTDATVVIPGRRGHAEEIVDLFEIDERGGAFRVKGRLAKVPAKYRAIVTNGNVYDHVFEITQVVTYSIERDRRKEIVLWVLGHCAWYAISPSEQYRPVFQQLLEKANLDLFFRDLYAGFLGTRKKLPPGTVQSVCKDFTVYESTCKTIRSASKLFHKHHRFLIFRMHRIPEETSFWERTPWYKEFLIQYPDVCHKATEILGPKPRRPTTRAAAQNTASQGQEPEPPMNNEQEKALEGEKTPVRESGESSDEGDEEEVEDSSDDGRMRTRSSKGKSTLRPKRVKAPPPPIPGSPHDDGGGVEDAEFSESPTLTRLKRKSEADDLAQDLEHEVHTKHEPVYSLTTSPEPVVQPPKSTRPGRRQLTNASAARLMETGNTPGGRHWKCTLGGLDCGHIVLNAKTREGRREIEEHYEKHGKIMKEAMETIGLETQASNGGPGYQVDNLLAKIEGMAKKWADTKPQPLRGLGE